VGQLYVKSFTDDNTRELWFLIVLAVLKLNPEDKNRLMEPLLAMVARELFGIECETVHDVHTTVHSTSEADGHDHHHITGVSAQGKIFIAYKNGNNIEFLYQGLEPPTKEICHPIGNDLSGWLHKFFTSRTRVSGEKAEQTNPTSAYENDLMVRQPVHSAQRAESWLLPTDVSKIPRIARVMQHRQVPAGHRPLKPDLGILDFQHNPYPEGHRYGPPKATTHKGHAPEESDYLRGTAFEREFDRRRRERPDRPSYEMNNFRHDYRA
jgi:hypothetical protein